MKLPRIQSRLCFSFVQTSNSQLTVEIISVKYAALSNSAGLISNNMSVNRPEIKAFLCCLQPATRFLSVRPISIVSSGLIYILMIGIN